LESKYVSKYRAYIAPKSSKSGRLIEAEQNKKVSEIDCRASAKMIV